MSQVNEKTKDNDEIDLGRLIGELIDHRKLIISITTLSTLIALIYAIFATPIFQADALVQIEQKQGNAILNNLSQVLPDSQPQSAPEIALLQSRMILGKTVNDLNLQINVQRKYFPLIGRGYARLTGQSAGEITVGMLHLESQDQTETPDITLKVADSQKFIIEYNGNEVSGNVGEIIKKAGLTIRVDSIDAKEGW